MDLAVLFDAESITMDNKGVTKEVDAKIKMNVGAFSPINRALQACGHHKEHFDADPNFLYSISIVSCSAYVVSDNVFTMQYRITRGDPTGVVVERDVPPSPFRSSSMLAHYGNQ
jgi:hypothetical protein